MVNAEPAKSGSYVQLKPRASARRLLAYRNHQFLLPRETHGESSYLIVVTLFFPFDEVHAFADEVHRGQVSAARVHNGVLRHEQRVLLND